MNGPLASDGNEYHFRSSVNSTINVEYLQRLRPVKIREIEKLYYLEKID